MVQRVWTMPRVLWETAVRQRVGVSGTRRTDGERKSYARRMVVQVAGGRFTLVSRVRGRRRGTMY